MIKKNLKKRPQINFSLAIAFVSIAFLLMLARTLTPQEGRLTLPTPTLQNTVQAPPLKTIAALPPQKALKKIPTYNASQFKLNLSAYSFNPTKGRLHAPKQVYVLGHIGCKPCYKMLIALNKVAERHPQKIRVITKFAAPLPLKNEAIEAGLFTLLAQDERAFWHILEHLPNPAQGPYTPLTYLSAFEAAGYSLKELRQKLGLNTQVYMQQLEKDLNTYRLLEKLPLPIVIMNNKVFPAAIVPDILQALKRK